MTKYVDLTKKKQFAGKEINEAKVGRFLRVIRNGEKVMVPLGQVKINDNQQYILADTGDIIIVYPPDGVTITKETYDTIMSHGQEIIDELFGDIMNKTENIK